MEGFVDSEFVKTCDEFVIGRGRRKKKEITMSKTKEVRK